MSHFLITFLRYIPAWLYIFPCRDLGIYANTFKEIMKVDIAQFLVVIGCVVLGFSGSIYMIHCASGMKGYDDVKIYNLNETEKGDKEDH